MSQISIDDIEKMKEVLEKAAVPSLTVTTMGAGGSGGTFTTTTTSSSSSPSYMPGSIYYTPAEAAEDMVFGMDYKELLELRRLLQTKDITLAELLKALEDM
jgi:hypothetical protein